MKNKTKIRVCCAYDKIIAVDKLKPHPDNPNKHSSQQIELMAKLLVAHGWRVPIVVSKDSGFITRGHGCLKAAIATGEKYVPVDFQSYADENAELADVVADNAIRELSYFDRGMLRDVLGDIDAHPIDIEFTGFSMFSVEELFGAAPPSGSGSAGGSTGEGGSETKNKKNRESKNEKKESSGKGNQHDDDIMFDFGIYRGRVQSCLFDDFEKIYEQARKEYGFVTLDDTLRYLVGM